MYAKYRPDYPGEFMDYLAKKIGFDLKWTVADIGSGTGILSELFLKKGNRVFCVEPNRDMRQVAEKNLAKYRPLFISVDGKAEATKLKPRSVDLIVSGQALHWFNLRKTRAEFKRILRQGGFVAVFYNHRKKGGRLELAYERLVSRHQKDKPPTPNIDAASVSKFLGNKVDTLVLPNSQTLTLDGILGRLASASYMPTRSSREWASLERDARKVVRHYGRNGTVRLRYDATLYLGRMS